MAPCGAQTGAERTRRPSELEAGQTSCLLGGPMQHDASAADGVAGGAGFCRRGFGPELIRQKRCRLERRLRSITLLTIMEL